MKNKNKFTLPDGSIAYAYCNFLKMLHSGKEITIKATF